MGGAAVLPTAGGYGFLAGDVDPAVRALHHLPLFPGRLCRGARRLPQTFADHEDQCQGDEDSK